MKKFYRQIPEGESTWVRDYAANTITFTDKEGRKTTGSLVAAGTEDTGNGLSMTIERNAFAFNLSGTDDWTNIYSDYDKFVKKSAPLLDLCLQTLIYPMKRFAILSVFFLWGGYAASQTVVSVDAKQIINEGYIGNGAQWDPYQLDYGKGRLDISEADWKKMYDRLDFMRPQFIRVMTNTTSVMQDGVLYPERGFGAFVSYIGLLPIA